MVEISQRGHSISIMPEKRKEVEFFLSMVDRKPVYIDDENNYKSIYLTVQFQNYIVIIDLD